MNKSVSQFMNFPDIIDIFDFFWITLEYFSEASSIPKTLEDMMINFIVLDDLF